MNKSCLLFQITNVLINSLYTKQVFVLHQDSMIAVPKYVFTLILAP